jgi:hypothetical protein
VDVKLGLLTSREEHRLRVFENRVLRRIFGPKRDGVTGGWRKFLNKEFSNLYSSLNILNMIGSRRSNWAMHVASMRKMKNTYGILVGEFERKGYLGRPTHKWG